MLRASQYSVIGLGDGGEPTPRASKNLDVPVLREEEAASASVSSAYVHQCMWDLPSPTGGQTYVPTGEPWSLNHWTASKVPYQTF